MSLTAGTRLGPYEVIAPLGTRPLFQPHILFGGIQPLGSASQFDVAPDGRFLVNVNMAASGPIRVIQNWAPASRP